MSTHRRHDLRTQNQPINSDLSNPINPDPESQPSNDTIVPQIVYYKEYTLHTDGLDNISIAFDSEEDKKNFELALLNRIWNRKETSLEYYTFTLVSSPSLFVPYNHLNPCDV